jgi:hypothetical protein
MSQLPVYQAIYLICPASHAADRRYVSGPRIGYEPSAVTPTAQHPTVGARADARTDGAAKYLATPVTIMAYCSVPVP